MADKTVTMSTGESEDGAPTGTIRWEIDNVSGLPENTHRYSPKIELHRMSWYLSIAKQQNDEDRLKYMAAYLYGLENDSIMWSFDVDEVFTVINKDSNKNIVDDCYTTMNHKISNWGLPNLIEWTHVIDENKGFIADDKVTIECRFTLTKIIGLSANPRFDFTDAKEPCHDVTLLVGGKKLYASKQILAVHSPVFKTMFYSDFAEKEKKQIELKDVEYEDFIETLNIIYPTGKKITDDTVERLLSVGDRFQIKTIVDQAEQFLIASTKFSVAAKLQLSDEYRLVQLQGKCLDSLKSISDVTDLNGTEEFNELSDTGKAALLEKIMKLAEAAKNT